MTDLLFRWQQNTRGFTIPLDKRLAADGRGLQEAAINDNFAKFAQSLYMAEAAAREEVAKRAAIQRKLAVNEKEQHEDRLRQLAQQARLKRAAGGAGATETSSAAAGDASAGAGAGAGRATEAASGGTPPSRAAAGDRDTEQQGKLVFVGLFIYLFIFKFISDVEKQN